VLSRVKGLQENESIELLLLLNCAFANKTDDKAKNEGSRYEDTGSKGRQT